MKRLLIAFSLGVGAALFSVSPAEAFFGNHWRSRQAGCGGYQGGSSGYAPYAYRSAYGNYGYSYGNLGYGNYGYSPGVYPSGDGGVYSSGFRGYSSYPYSRFGGATGLMGYGNGYYYGGFPASRASGIGIGVYPGRYLGW